MDFLEQEKNDGIENVININEERQSKIVIWDADSILHYVLYSGKDELGNKNPEYTEADLEYLQGKLTEMVLKTLNNIEKYFNILRCYIFIGGKDNFRKQLYPDYKKNRPSPNPLIYKLKEYFILAHGAILADGYEAEDYVYTLSNKIDNNGIVVYVDHDLEEIPSIMYNYKKDIWSKISEKEALYNKYKKLILGEQNDRANFTPSIGIKYFEKNFYIDMTIEEYEAATWEAYLYAWSDKVKVKNKIQRTPNPEKAKEMLELAKQIIWLKQVEE